MTAIEKKKKELGARKFGRMILDKTISVEKSSGSGGVVQEFSSNGTLCNIYSHPDVGTFEVHGAILDKYLKIGATGDHPKTHTRQLGYPKSDELRTKDGYAVESTFEWGSICASYGAGAVPMYGSLYRYWKSYVGSSYMGYPLCEPIPFTNGRSACFFENALLIRTEPVKVFTITTQHVIHFEYAGPLVGNPQITPIENLQIDKCYAALVPTLIWNKIASTFPTLLNQICKDRLYLESVQTKGRIPASLAIFNVDLPNPDHPTTVKVKLSLTAANLLTRTLYNIGVENGNGGLAIIGLHCVYAKNQWESFGVMHATDLHLSETNDRLYTSLCKTRKDGKSFAATADNNFVNFNDNFRDFIRYANKLHKQGEIDIIMLTGDLIDFQFETFYDKASQPFGNFLFFQKLLQGKNKSPKNTVLSEELLVPVLVCLGNHDYRRLSYLLNFASEIRASSIIKALEFDSLGEIIGGRTGEVIAFIGKPLDTLIDLAGNVLDLAGDALDAALDWIPGFGSDATRIATVADQSYFGQYNLIQSEMIGIYNSEQVIVTPTRAINMLIVDEPKYYFNRINNKAKSNGATVTHLGNNAIMMVESGSDNGAPKGTDSADTTNLAFDKTFGTGGESRQNMIGGDPNLIGITAQHVTTLTQLLNNPKVTGTVLVGIHGPLVNMKGNDFPPYFRESVYQTRPRTEVEAFLNSYHPFESHQPWLTAMGSRYFTTGTVENRLDSGTCDGLTDQFVKLCAGRGAARPIDVLFSGHIHRNVEFRIKWNNAERRMEYYYDFYSENPSTYYNTKLKSANNRNSIVTRLVQDAFMNESHAIESHRTVNGKIVKFYQLVTKPNPSPLNSTVDKKAWWNSHRPLITQTAALGPLEGAQREDPKAGKDRISEAIFQGFRVVKIKDNTVDKMHYVTLKELRANRYKMSWEGEYQPRFAIPVDHVISTTTVKPSS